MLKATFKKRISNNEYRITNADGRYAIYFIKTTERRETTLRNSVRRRRIILLFCGWLFDPGEVSYKKQENNKLQTC
jgi:hypothetical protein